MEKPEKIVVNLIISKDLKEKVRELAIKKETSMNALIRTAIIELLEKEK